MTTVTIKTTIYTDETQHAKLRTVAPGVDQLILLELGFDEDDQPVVTVTASRLGDTPAEVAGILHELADGLEESDQVGEPGRD